MSAEKSVLPLVTGSGMPAREPLAMPTQDLRAWCAQLPPDGTDLRVVWARLVTFGGGFALTAFGLYEMIRVVSLGGITILEGIMTVLFTVTFSWIALAATTALAGVIAGPRMRTLASARTPLTTRTALVMPIYHEDARRTTACLQAMAEDLARVGAGGAFEIVVLSDSTNPDAWVRETLAINRLARDLAGVMPVWYRRRWHNTAKKAGNVKDFVEHWGGRYDHMVVLDADSLMSAETLVCLVQAMQADPKLGILQTVPVLANGRTLFARLQQFAGRVHGPIVARGLAAWQGFDGNYWGHNAIIRTAAFAGACGLPDLPGRKPFGGHILSHDFVEAALIRRAGWRVEMASELTGSWEESPPSLIDVAIRDRRWAQGNLQHSKVIGARGLAWPSRIHFATGIMSYAASPLWLLLIVAGLALSAQAHFIRPEYFAKDFQLFPTWPRFDSERMIQLFILTMGVLFFPKMLGLIRGLLEPELRRGCGGALALVGSTLLEIVLTSLYAPIMMLVHSRHVFEILTGNDAGWSKQRRGQGGSDWYEPMVRHRWHTGFGVGIVILATFISPAMIGWLSPIILGLVFAIPLSWMSGNARIGTDLAHAGLLLTPEETAPHPILRRADAIEAGLPDLPEDGIAIIIADPAARAEHFDRVGEPPAAHRGHPEPELLTAATKIREATTRREALAWLKGRERLFVASHRTLAEALAQLPIEPDDHQQEAALARRA
ncbi:glucans biosynthesis glucosyltransferase MdoH [Propylenella binzhouense]|uniref:Glucans biosynthesis glucosyltransferase H n=1 Tax=Propylenella binzhouense TaxID=2555902 RepID=A0A964T1Q2_9HYPH|nr:glucans biosynthesis glucosyltransferase MdoH [Propylenella binzhouense]MYZ46710.1 glucans biosynthesis glucosyltransferase MdoH [Propylenella binzhouense]